MATQFARTFPSSAPVPFLLAGSSSVRSDPGFAAAVQTAMAADKIKGGTLKACQRIARFLCEIGKSYGCRNELPLSRAMLANVLGISLVRVKRTLGLLTLSGVVSCASDSITVLDWRKLSGAARFDPADLNLLREDEDLPEYSSRPATEDEDHFLTANGDPACFV